MREEERKRGEKKTKYHRFSSSDGRRRELWGVCCERKAWVEKKPST